MMQVVNTIETTKTEVDNPTDQKTIEWMNAIARDRDPKAFQLLYEHYAPRLKHYMIRQGADSAGADDLAQEAMVQVWRKAEQYDPARASPSCRRRRTASSTSWAVVSLKFRGCAISRPRKGCSSLCLKSTGPTSSAIPQRATMARANWVA